MVEPMLALSILQPWAWAIVKGFKPLENRTWRPSRHFIGKRFAIHAGKGTTDLNDPDVKAFIGRRIGYDRLWTPEQIHLGAVVGTAVLVDIISNSDEPWFVGPHALRLGEVHELATPMPCKGALGFWSLPLDLAAQIQERRCEAKEASSVR